MKSYRKVLEFNVPSRMAFIKITDQVQSVLEARAEYARDSVWSTRCILRPAFSSTTTSRACMRIMHGGWSGWPRTIQAPKDTGTTAREKTTATRTTSARSWDERSWWLYQAGALDFGPWEQIFYGEFDGRRRKRVLVKIIGD